MTVKDFTKANTPLLMQLQGFTDYLVRFYRQADNNPVDFMRLLDAFRQERESGNQFSSHERIIYGIIRENWYRFLKNTTPPILHYDPTLAVDESVVLRFDKAMTDNRTGRGAPVEAPEQHYRSYTEYNLYYEVKDNNIINDFDGAYHPLVYITLSNSVGNAGDVNLWFRYLSKALDYAISYPNKFWHSFYGMYGCACAMWSLIHHTEKLSLLDDVGLKRRYYTLLYLYMTRAIALGEQLNAPQTYDLYMNRAQLCIDRKDFILTLFAENSFFISPDIQFISDCYLAHRIGSRCGLGPIVLEALNKSKMMYEYGTYSDVLSKDNGYFYVEDAGWLELVERGRKRNLEVGNALVSEFEAGRLDLNPVTLEGQLTRLLADAIIEPKVLNYKWIDNFLDSQPT